MAANPIALQGASARRLDELVAVFRKLAGEGAVIWWKQGRVLAKIHDSGAFRSRYASWADFVASELDVSANYVRSVMRIAREYTEERAVRLGITRCVALLKATDDARPMLEERVLSGELAKTDALRLEVVKANVGRTFVRQRQRSGEVLTLHKPQQKQQRYVRAKLTPALVAALKREAGERSIGVGELVADIVVEYLERRGLLGGA